MSKKVFSKNDKIKHEQQFIEHLEKQIEFFKKEKDLDKVKSLKYKLDKARLVLKLLTV
jgi:CCR4-NOT transcriptional regulation complex NOT5 subunit